MTESLKNASFTNNSDFIVKSTTIHSLEYLNSIDVAKLVSTFQKPERKKHPSHDRAVSQLIILVSQINELHREMKGFMKDMMDRYGVYEAAYQNNLTILRNLNDEWSIKYNHSETADLNLAKFIGSYFKIFVDWAELGQDVAFKATNDKIISKTLDLCRQIRHPIALLPMKTALDAKVAYLNIEKTENIIIAQFVKIARDHKRAARKIKVIINIIKWEKPWREYFKKNKKKRSGAL